jgi:kinetochore protein NDC80
MEHGYSASVVSSKALKSPSVKEFKSIAQFLFKQLDSNYPGFGDKDDEEIVTMFRQLGYSTPISKSHIASAGTPHAWPHLVAALSWLIELLSYDEAVTSEVTRTEEADDTSDKFMQNYLSASYELFLDGEDDEFDNMKQEFMDGFEGKNAKVSEQTKVLEDRNATLSADIAVVQNRRAELPKLTDKKAAYESDLIRFDALVRKLEDHKGQLHMKTKDRETEMTRLTNSLASINQEIATLQYKVANQEMKPEDVAIMVAERERIESARERATERRTQMHRKAWNSETKLRDCVQEVENAARTYNSIASDLKFIPADAVNANKIDFSIKINSSAKELADFLKTDVKTVLLRHIGDVKDKLEKGVTAKKVEQEKKREALEDSEQRKIDLQQQEQSAKDKISRLEDTYKLEKSQLDGLIAMHGKEMQEMEQRLIVARDSGAEEAKAATAQRHLSEILSARENMRAEHARSKASIIDAIETVVSDCAAHREYVMERLSEIKSQHEQELQDQMEYQSSNSSSMAMPPVPPY